MIANMRKKMEGSVSLPPSVEMRKPDDKDESEDYDGLEACAEDLINAVHAKNPKLVKEALRAAFDICEMYPHEEGPHIQGEE